MAGQLHCRIMRIRITKWTGSQSDGIVLSTRGSVIRVAIPGSKDAAEFSCQGWHWFSEDGEPVEVDFLTTDNAGTHASPVRTIAQSRSKPVIANPYRTQIPTWVN